MSVDAVALPDWARAYAEPALTVEIRRTPQDFQVTEDLGFEPSGHGEHDFLFIEKCGVNTAWLARQLAKHASVDARDVGYSGLKDRRAVTRQWFSVRRPGRDGTDWDGLSLQGVCILDSTRNARKLRRGAHRANSFRIALRGPGIGAAEGRLCARLAAIEEGGIPNYFGEQRFGHAGGNLGQAIALFAGARLRRDARGFALSAARSFLFNSILDRRVRDGSWQRLLPGDRPNLDGSGSVFELDVVTPELERRVRDLDIHPTATLWGVGAPLTAGQAAVVEQAVATAHADLASGLVRARLEAASRPLRVSVQDPAIDIDEEVAWLEFRLRKGAFATAVLREIVNF